MQYYYSGKQAERRPGTVYWIVLFSTAALLLLLTVTFFVAQAVSSAKGIEPIHSGTPSVSKKNGDDNDGKGETIKSKTGITLPCATSSGVFKSSLVSPSSIEGIKSECAILVDLSNNTSIAEKNSDATVHPASMSKLMTLLVACESAEDPTALLTVKQEMLDRSLNLEGSGQLVENATVVDANGDVKKIKIAGKAVTLEDALFLINYQSDTVACMMVAEYISGSEDAFVAKMNSRAASMGLSGTRFVNSTGLTEKDGSHNTTTCREMAAIMAAVLNNKTACKIVSSYEKYTVELYADGKKEEYKIPFYAGWQNLSARLAGNTKISGTSLTVSGGKTGYEDIPTSCFATYATDSKTGKKYICVTVGRALGSSGAKVNNATSTADTRKIYQSYAK